MLPAKPVLTLVTLIALLALPEYVQELEQFRSLDWGVVPTVLEFVPRERPEAPLDGAGPRAETDPASYSLHRLLDSKGDLDSFYAALRRTEMREGEGVTRILHYGDSPTTADLITADARDLFQAQFGDAGHGFHLIAKPWAWYGHRGIDVDATGWEIRVAGHGGLRDGLYGLGGAAFFGKEDEAYARIRLRRPGGNRMEIAYLEQPGGGSFAVDAGGRTLGVVETSGAERASAYAAFPLAETDRRIEIRVLRGGVRLFGVQFTNEGPGVEYHSLGLNGAYVSVLARFFNEAHWGAQLRHYRPDLIVVNYGTNESVYPAFVEHSYAKEMREVIRRIRAALPGTSILIMSPMDRGERDAEGEIGTVAALPKLVAIQERLAAEEGCGFFNTYEAMGGAGTMGRWYQASPRLVGADFIHPLPAGAKIVGNLLYKALLDGYNRYKLRRMRKGE